VCSVAATCSRCSCAATPLVEEVLGRMLVVDPVGIAV
jgi:hypothetical protein